MPQPFRPPKPKAENCHLLRFVLHSGAALELNRETLDDVTEGWADTLCSAICGCKADGTKVLIPTENIAYVEEVVCG